MARKKAVEKVREVVKKTVRPRRRVIRPPVGVAKAAPVPRARRARRRAARPVVVEELRALPGGIVWVRDVGHTRQHGMLDKDAMETLCGKSAAVMFATMDRAIDAPICTECLGRQDAILKGR